MKKFVIIMLIAVVAVTSVFAADLQIGVMQNLVNTSVIMDTEFEHFGVETAVGFPLIWYAGSAIGALGNSGKDNTDSSAVARGDSSESESESNSSFAIPLGGTVNIYWKVINGKKFSLRLGIQADVVGLFGPQYVWATGHYGPSLGFNYKFTDSFSMNLTGAVPLALITGNFGDGQASNYTYFFYTSDPDDVASNIIFGIFGTIGAVCNQFARLSLKWEI